ncbi:MAG: ABC transporter ATP-binding protein [Actinomycetes bacterium]
MSAVLTVKNLAVDFYAKGAIVNSPLRGIDFDIDSGKTLGIVGETGCGKTLSALAIMGLLPENAVQTGEISLSGVGKLSSASMKSVRGKEISMIFQNPHSALNPTFSIRDQLKYVAQSCEIQKSEIESTSREGLHSVGLRDVDRILNSYPHELSGGMLQRCMIAMSLLSKPKLLIADEPTTALDATVGRQVLDLLLSLQAQNGFAMLFISHDVGAVSHVADQISVLYAGKVVENGPSSSLLDSPRHPYTRGLFGAVPSVKVPRGELVAIPGAVPLVTLGISGCAFSTRCTLSDGACDMVPPSVEVHGHRVACWKVS